MSDQTVNPSSQHRPVAFGDFVVYVDESGDHSLRHIDNNFPILALAFCIFEKSDYASQIVPSVQRLKFRHFGHDMVILHEREIRKRIGAFKALKDSLFREAFLEDLNACLQAMKFKIIPIVIDKNAMVPSNITTSDAYQAALVDGLLCLKDFLRANDQKDKQTFIVLESRGKVADSELIKDISRFHQISADTDLELTLVFASKLTNSVGLQLADLVARPIGIRTLKPWQQNRAFEIIEPKLVLRKNKAPG